MFQPFQEEQEKRQKTPEELFLEHFTAEPVRNEVLEETTSDQAVMTTPARPQQEKMKGFGNSGGRSSIRSFVSQELA